MPLEPMTSEFRMQRKTVKDILSHAPDGIEQEELTRLAADKGVKGEEYQKVLASLLNGGRVYIDKTGKVHYVRSE
jgi:hypothetical protein